MWKGIVFTSPFHDICYLSFNLIFEGMTFVVDNIKILKIIGDTNMIIIKMNYMFACPKKA